MKYRLISSILVLFCMHVCAAQTVTDIDGNTYNTINIGSQTWMKENLKTIHFNNGIIIPTTRSAILVDSTSIFQWAYNGDSTNVNIYGRLYTWFTVVNNNNVCLTGWHVPDDTERITLTTYLGGDSIAGGKMKETGITHWSTSDNTVTNSSLFSGLPGGKRGNPMGFGNIGSSGAFWSSTSWGTSAFQRGYWFSLNAGNNGFLETVAVANCGMSVRCIKNASTSIETNKLEKKIQIFPNPIADRMTIAVESPAIGTLFIYNMKGESVFQKRIFDQMYMVDLETLKPGVYILKVIGSDCEIERKFIKE